MSVNLRSSHATRNNNTSLMGLFGFFVINNDSQRGVLGAGFCANGVICVVDNLYNSTCANCSYTNLQKEKLRLRLSQYMPEWGPEVWSL